MISLKQDENKQIRSTTDQQEYAWVLVERIQQEWTGGKLSCPTLGEKQSHVSA